MWIALVSDCRYINFLVIVNRSTIFLFFAYLINVICAIDVLIYVLLFVYINKNALTKHTQEKIITCLAYANYSKLYSKQ